MPRKEDNIPATLRAISVLEALVSRMPLARALQHLPELRRAADAMAATFAAS